MWVFYLLSLVPICIGGVLWYQSPAKVIWREWLASALISLLLACVAHYQAFVWVTADKQVLSGSVSEVVYHPEWTQVVEDRDSGNNERKPKYVNHPARWTANSRDLNSSVPISEEQFNQLKELLGSEVKPVLGNKSGFSSGDRNIYVTANTTGVLVPMTDQRPFTNRLRNRSTLYTSAAEGGNKTTFEYPYPASPLTSNRLLGTASGAFSIQELDRLNAILGPRMKVNVIIVGFLPTSHLKESYQLESDWIGGKPNDLVICYGQAGRDQPAAWCRVFGWTEEPLVKMNLETLFTSQPINNAILKSVQAEIESNYKVKQWSRFDYIAVEPPAIAIVWFIVIQAIVQGALWVLFHSQRMAGPVKSGPDAA